MVPKTKTTNSRYEERDGAPPPYLQLCEDAYGGAELIDSVCGARRRSAFFMPAFPIDSRTRIILNIFPFGELWYVRTSRCTLFTLSLMGVDVTSQIAVIHATLRYTTQEELIAGMKPLLSKRGLFIYTRTTRPVGSQVRFEFTLADGSQTYAGEGVVRREVPFIGGPSSQKSGMLVSLQRVNRPFKAVVDAILDHAEPEHRAMGKQFIVESRAGEHQGFDLFGDIDLDEGLDSLFSGIAKKPAPPENKSGLYVPPTVVSGMFNSPDNEIMLEYQSDDEPEPIASPIDNSLGSRLGTRRSGMSVQEKSRAITGQYSSVVDNIASAEREAAQSKFNAINARVPSGVYDEAPTVNEMQAIMSNSSSPNAYDDTVQGDATVEMSPSVEGNMFGDALDFDHSPVVQRMEREFEFERHQATRDETPVRMEQVVTEPFADRSPFGSNDERFGTDDRGSDQGSARESEQNADTFAPTATEAAAFASAESIESNSDNNAESAQSFDYNQAAADSFDYGQATSQPFDYGHIEAKPFDYGQAASQPFDYGHIDAKPFDYDQTSNRSDDQAGDQAIIQPDSQLDLQSNNASVESNTECHQEAEQNSGSLGESDPFRASNPIRESAPIYEPVAESAHKQAPISTPIDEPIQAHEPVQAHEPAQDDVHAPLFQMSDGAQETPSELFEALQADILGTPSGEMPSVDMAIMAAQAPVDPPIVPQSGLEDLATVTIPRSQPQPIKLASSQAESSATKPTPRKEISLDDLISQSPTPRHAPQPVQQSTADLINTDMTTLSRPAPRRRDTGNASHADVPTPKKGGFFSNLFKK